MALLAEDDELELEGPHSSSQSDRPLFSDKRDKKSRLEDKRSSTRTLPWAKSKDSTVEKTPKKSKHNRNKSGSRTPPVPESPKLLRADEASRSIRVNQPSPSVKNNRKSYSQLGDWSDEEGPGFTFSNEPALASSPPKTLTSQPTEPQPSPNRRTTVQFPVFFGETTLHPKVTRGSVPLLSDTPSQMFPIHSPSQSLGTHHLPLQAPIPASPPPESDWRVSDELRDKCASQFQELSTSDGLLQGDKAREFFVLSKLPNQELSAIWRLADVDRDNALSEGEFCVAMKLVMMRRSGHEIPATLPATLLPYLVSRTSSNSGPRTNTSPTLESSGVLVDFEGDTPYINTMLDFGEEAPDVDALVDYGEAAPDINTLVDLGEAAPDINTLVDFGEEAPDITTILDFGGEAPDINVLVDLGEAAPDINTLVDLGGEAPDINTLVDLGEEAPDVSDEDGDNTVLMHRRTGSEGSITKRPSATVRRSKTVREPGEILINIDQGTPQQAHKTNKKYQALDCDDDSTDGDWSEKQVKGHSRVKSLDLNKMINTDQNVLEDLPLAEPPKPPPRPHQSPPLEHTKTEGESGRARSLSTGSITKRAPQQHASHEIASHDDTKTLVQDKPKIRKHTRVAPRRPPPPVKKPELRTDKKELQGSIRGLKDQNAGLTEVNKALEAQLFKLMEERVRLEHQLELLNM